jgi:hypothetical protein
MPCSFYAYTCTNILNIPVVFLFRVLTKQTTKNHIPETVILMFIRARTSNLTPLKLLKVVQLPDADENPRYSTDFCLI